MAGDIRVGIGGWTFEPWRGAFYPEGLSQKKELEFASRAVTSIEINGTYYSTFKPESWRNWRDTTPEGFVFSVKASRFCTNRRVLTDARDSIAKFLNQGLSELGPKLGPINWQFMATKKFEAADFAGFLKLLPAKQDGVKLRHAVEVRSPTFVNPEFVKMAKDHNVAIVTAMDEDFPEIDERTADFTYARFMATTADAKDGVTPKELKAFAAKAAGWAKGGDVFAYFIAGEKVKNPAAAQALIKALAKG
ncbi:MAG: DUF72 domain-containing protein [Micropepsaceae bacterium]